MSIYRKPGEVQEDTDDSLIKIRDLAVVIVNLRNKTETTRSELPPEEDFDGKRISLGSQSVAYGNIIKYLNDHFPELERTIHVATYK